MSLVELLASFIATSRGSCKLVQLRWITIFDLTDLHRVEWFFCPGRFALLDVSSVLVMNDLTLLLQIVARKVSAAQLSAKSLA